MATNWQDPAHLEIRYGCGPGKLSPDGARAFPGDSGVYGTIADVNGDGRADVLSDRVWLNEGEGTFTAAGGPGGVSALPGSLASIGSPFAWGGDSAAPDLFVTADGGAVVRYPNLGGGNFGAAVTVVPGNPRVATTGLAIAMLPEISALPCLVRTLQTGTQQSLELYVQNGGNFTLAAKLAAGAYRDSKVQALRDGSRDRILLTTGRTSKALAPVEVRPARNGNRVTLKMVTLEKPTAVRAEMALADVDGDGTNDLVLAGSGMAWHAGASAAAFSTVRREVSAVDQGDVVCWTGDLNHDGAVDLITQVPQAGALLSRVTLWLNAGHGEFFQAVTLPVSGDRVGFVAAGDWDHDGWPDLLVRVTKLNGYYEKGSNNRLLLINRYPNGRMGQTTLITYRGMAWRDARLQNGDADGISDFVTSCAKEGDPNYLHYQTFTGKSATEFAAKPSTEGPEPLMPLFTDMDWNGTLDATYRPNAIRYRPPSSDDGGTSIIINYPSTTPLIPGSGIQSGDVWPSSLDFDHDGHTDFISKWNGYDVIMPARLTATATPHAAYSLSPADYGNYARFRNQVVCYARMHGSPDYDAIYQTDSDLRFRESLGGLNFGPEIILSESFVTGPGSILTADLDGDGVQDIIASSSGNSSRLRWFKGVKN